MNGEIEQEVAAWVEHNCAGFLDPARRFVETEVSEIFATMNCQISEYGRYKRTDVQE